MFSRKTYNALLVTVFFMLTAASPVLVSARPFRDCWLLFGGVDDIGWSHAMNLGRLQIHRYLRKKYSNYTFETVAYPNTFFMAKKERETLINQTIADGCNFIMAGSDNLLNNLHVEYATEFPNISFGRMTGYPNQDNPPNLVDFGGSWFNISFVAGAVAATTSETCAGFINALETTLSAWSHSTAFMLGYHWVKPHQPGYIVTMNSYYNPPSEVLAAKHLVERKGCDVFGRHTDPNDVDRYIYSLGGQALSIARYIDMSTFVGDTVFTSQVINVYDFVAHSAESAFLSSSSSKHNGAGGSMYKLDGSGDPIGVQLHNMQLSPFTSLVNETSATNMQGAAWDYLANNNPLCNARWRQGNQIGNYSADVAIPVPVPDGRTCPYDLEINPVVSYLELPNVTYYDSFQDGGAICAAGGQQYTYTDNLTMSCQACPENTFSVAEERAGSSCTPCADGTIAPPGSSQCVSPATVATNTTVSIAVGATAAVLILTILIGAIIIIQKRKGRDNTCAPKHPDASPIAIMFTDIEASTNIWANAPEAMSRAIGVHHDLIRQVLDKHKGYEVKTIGDAFMVVHSDIESAVSIALDVQRSMFHHDWGTSDIDNTYVWIMKDASAMEEDIPSSPPKKDRGISFFGNDKVWNGLRVRIGIAYGTCTGTKDPVTGGWDYFGTSVNTAARVEAVAHGGQVLLTGPAYDALIHAHASPPDNRDDGDEVKHVVPKESQVLALPESVKNGLNLDSVKSHGTVSLRGLPELVEVLELVPVGFEDRQFPPIRVDENPLEIEEGECDDEASATLSILSGAFTIAEDIYDVSHEEIMSRLVDFALRVSNIANHHGSSLSAEIRTTHDGIKSILSLHSAYERTHIIEGLLSKWHLCVPKVSEKIVKVVGKDTPAILMLSVRAATIEHAARQKQQRLEHESSRVSPDPLVAMLHETSPRSFLNPLTQYKK